MTCQRTYGKNAFGMKVENVICDEHDFTECPKGAMRPLPRFRNNSPKHRPRGLKKQRGSYAKSQARYFGHPQLVARAAMRALLAADLERAVDAGFAAVLDVHAARGDAATRAMLDVETREPQ